MSERQGLSLQEERGNKLGKVLELQESGDDGTEGEWKRGKLLEKWEKFQYQIVDTN